MSHPKKHIDDIFREQTGAWQERADEVWPMLETRLRAAPAPRISFFKNARWWFIALALPVITAGLWLLHETTQEPDRGSAVHPDSSYHKRMDAIAEVKENLFQPKQYRTTIVNGPGQNNKRSATTLPKRTGDAQQGVAGKKDGMNEPGLPGKRSNTLAIAATKKTGERREAAQEGLQHRKNTKGKVRTAAQTTTNHLEERPETERKKEGTAKRNARLKTAIATTGSGKLPATPQEAVKRTTQQRATIKTAPLTTLLPGSSGNSNREDKSPLTLPEQFLLPAATLSVTSGLREQGSTKGTRPDPGTLFQMQQRKDKIPAAVTLSPDVAGTKSSIKGQQAGKFSFGLIAGAERGTGTLSGNSFILSAYGEKALSNRISIAIQPGIKYRSFSDAAIRDRSYHDIKSNRVDSTFWYDAATKTNYTTYLFNQRYDSIVVHTSVERKSWELELPVLILYKLTGRFSLSAGPVLHIGGMTGVSEDQRTVSTIEKKDSLLSLTYSLTEEQKNNYFTHNTDPVSSYSPYRQPNAAVRLGYMMRASAALSRSLLLELSLQQTLYPWSRLNNPLLSDRYSPPYIRLGINYRLK